MDTKVISITLARIWRRLNDSLLPKIILTAATSSFLAGCLQQSLTVQEQLKPTDVFVYSIIYSSWAVFCLPDILERFNFRFIRRTLVIWLMLYQTELSLSAWSYLCAHVPALQQTDSDLETPEPGLEWLQNVAVTVRFILLLTCLSTTVVAYLCNWPEVLDEEFDDDDEVDEDSPSWLFESSS